MADSSGGFGFYNLPEGDYTVTLDPKTLPESYFPLSPPAVTVHVAIDGQTPAVQFLIEKREAQVPTRKVFEKPLPLDPPR